MNVNGELGGKDSFVSPWHPKAELSLKKEIKKLSDKIEAFQRQIRKEPQLNRQIEMNSEARAMKQQLQELKKELDKWNN